MQGVLRECLLYVLVELVVACLRKQFFYRREQCCDAFAILMRAVADGGRVNFACTITAPMQLSLGSLATQVGNIASVVNARRETAKTLGNMLPLELFNYAEYI